MSNEKFVKDHVGWLNQLKLRYSFGEVGNDKMSDDKRFPYITTLQNDGNYHFGNLGVTNKGGIRIATLGTSGLTWEVARKHNFGIDLTVADDFTFVIDIFRDKREKIFMKRGIFPIQPDMMWQIPIFNLGQMSVRC